MSDRRVRVRAGGGGHTQWEEAGKQDVQAWIAWLLDRYSAAYASNQFRALQQFFRWLADEEDIPDPMAGLKPPHVPDKPIPVSTMPPAPSTGTSASAPGTPRPTARSCGSG